MKMTMLILVLLAHSACGQATKHVDDGLVEYFHDFQSVVGNHGDFDSYDIKFGETENAKNGQAAVCQLGGSDWKITVDQGLWSKLPETRKRLVIYHELTHCAFKIYNHSNDPGSYMYWFPNDFDRSHLEAQVRDFLHL